jgi:hypothetical protein
MVRANSQQGVNIMPKRTTKNQHTTAVVGKPGPKQVLKAFEILADFISEKQERVDRTTGEVRTVDLNGSVTRDFLDTQCWKTNQMIERLTKAVEEIGRRAAYYERAYGSKEVQDEDLEKVAEQLEDAQLRLATVEELHRLACKTYFEQTGKTWIPKSKAIETVAPAVERPMTPALARLAAARVAADKSKMNGAVQ